MRTKLAYPCTGHVGTEGFADFLATEFGESRQNLRLLEAELRQTLGAPFVTLVNSGSSANLAAALLVKERCGPRRRVLLSGFSFPTTIASFSLCGFDVRLVDTEPGGFNLDPAKVQAELDERTAAVVATHFLGFPPRLGQIAALAHSRGALLVQDACETMDLRIDGKSLYDFGDIITHSFYHPHHLSSFGGGAVIVNTAEMHQHVQSIVHWGRACRCHYDSAHCPAPEGVDHNFWYLREGINVEMSELNACFGRWQLRSWPAQEARRWEHWRIWEGQLAGLPGVRLWPARANISPFVFPIGVAPERFGTLSERLLSRGVEVRNLMGGAIHRQPAFKHLAHAGLRNCEAMGSQTFFVGIHQTLATEKVHQAAAVVREVLEKT